MTDEQVQMLAETNMMVKMMYDQFPTFATKERVDAVEDKAEHAYAKAASVHTEIVEHVEKHTSMTVNKNLILGSYAGVIASTLIAIFKK
jgi:hypothetical protein